MESKQHRTPMPSTLSTDRFPINLTISPWHYHTPTTSHTTTTTTPRSPTPPSRFQRRGSTLLHPSSPIEDPPQPQFCTNNARSRYSPAPCPRETKALPRVTTTCSPATADSGDGEVVLVVKGHAESDMYCRPSVSRRRASSLLHPTSAVSEVLVAAQCRTVICVLPKTVGDVGQVKGENYIRKSET